MSKATDLYPAVNALYQEYTIMRSRLVKWYKDLSDGDQIAFRPYYNKRMNILDDKISEAETLLQTTCLS
jgi:hypothetical protein